MLSQKKTNASYILVLAERLITLTNIMLLDVDHIISHLKL